MRCQVIAARRQDIARQIEALGASLTASAGADSSGVSLETRADRVGEAAVAFSDAEEAAIDSATVSVTVEIKFQNPSTARTVAENGTPRTRAVAAPLLPDAEPGEALSPATRTCRRTSELGFTASVAVEVANDDEAVSKVARGEGSAVRGSMVKMVVP